MGHHRTLGRPSFLPTLLVGLTQNTLKRCFFTLCDLSQVTANLTDGLRSSGFEPAAFRATFEGSLRQLKLPELVLNVGDAAQNISDCFNAEVRSHDMAKLRLALQKALTGVHQRLLAEFTSKVTELCQRLQAVSDSLEQEMAKDLHMELSQLRKAFANKEQELQSYEALIALAQSFLIAG